MSFAFVRLSGTIPSWLGNAQSLTDLSLYYNGLIGSLPTDLAKLPLVVLSMGGNNLVGTIPAALGECRCVAFVGEHLSGHSFSSVYLVTHLKFIL